MAAIMPNPAFDLQQKWRRFPEHLEFHHQRQHQHTSFPNSTQKQHISPLKKKQKKGEENSTYKPHKSSTDKQQSAQSSESDSHSSQIDTNPPATTSPLRRFPTLTSLHRWPPRAASLLKVRPVGSRERSRARPCCWSGGRTRSKVRKRSAWSRRRIPWRVDAFFRGGATWLLGLFTEEKNIKNQSSSVAKTKNKNKKKGGLGWLKKKKKKLTNNIINHKSHKILQLHRSLSQRMCPICPAERHGSNHGRNGLSSPPGFNSIPDETGHETDKHGEIGSSHSPAHSWGDGVGDVMASSDPLWGGMLVDILGWRGMDGSIFFFFFSFFFWCFQLTPQNTHKAARAMGEKIPAARACFPLNPKAMRADPVE